MNVAHLQLGILGALGAACLVGYVVESRRAHGVNVLRDGEPPQAVRKFRVPEGDWLALGVGEGPVSSPAAIEIVSSGFELVGEEGHAWLVPPGAKVIVRAVEGARRTPVHATIASDASRFRLEIAPGTELYARASARKSAEGEHDARVLAGFGVPLVLGGKRNAAAGQAFAGCWLMLLFTFIVGGAFGADVAGWIAIGLAATFVVIGMAAMPVR